MEDMKPTQAADVRRPTHNFFIKTIAVIAFTVLMFCAVLGLCCALIPYIDRQNGQDTAYESSLLSGELRGYNELAAMSYREAGDAQTGAVSADALAERLQSYTGETNYRFVLTDADGQVLASNIGGQTVQKAGWPHKSSGVGREDLFVQGYVAVPPAVQDDIAETLRLAAFLYDGQNTLLTLGIVSLALAVLVFIFLMCAAGRHRDSADPRRSLIDRIPFDLLLLVSAGVAALAVLPFNVGMHLMWQLFLAAESVLLVLNILWALMMCMTLAARIKTRTFWRNNLCAYALVFCWRIVRGVCRWVKGLFTGLPILWKGILGFFGIGLFLLLSYTAARNGSGMGGLLCFAGVVGLFVLMVAVIRQLHALKKGGEALAGGDLSRQIETRGMLPEFRRHGENLNSIAAGMNRAVNERMKSERMKTDLITNVSHDLKTPLTSIVSYVDLLKKEALGNETAADYIEVLDRQAARLKKLTEDLVEASKASSGVLKASLAPTDVLEILNQSLAEYGDRLRQAELTPVLSRRTGTLVLRSGSVTIAEASAAGGNDEPLLVQADGRLLWRVFDNLLNNIVKYALPGTRVYIDVVKAEKRVAVAFKNISRDPLNIPASELTERFVRGDASRNSEGSGLGLSIAKSLAELQNAAFALDVSGDLVVATVALDLSRTASAPAGFDSVQIAQTNPGGEAAVDIETERDSQPYATNLLTQAEKTEESIEAAKAHVDANEK